MIELPPFTEQELAAHAKGFGKRFDDYVDIDEPIRIALPVYGQIAAWCEPYMERRHEVQGAVVFHFEEVGLSIERAYVMSANSKSLRTTCEMDWPEMQTQIREHYPECAFTTDRVGLWHLHPGYYPSLSVGDVEECRATLRTMDAVEETRELQLLMYGDPRGGWQLSGYLVGLSEVNRLPVRIVEAD